MYPKLFDKESTYLSQFTLLYGAKQLLTLHGLPGARRGSALQDLGIIENGSVLIEDGLICAVGPTRRIENLKQARDAAVIDVAGSLVMPGMTDPDFHVTYPAAESGGAVRSRRPGKIYEESLELLRACLQHGTLSAVLKASAEMSDFHSDLQVLRQLAKIGPKSVATVRTWQLNRAPNTDDEYLDFQQTLLTLARKHLANSVSLSSSSLTEGAVPAWAAQLMDAGLPLNLEWKGCRGHDLAALLAVLQPRTVSCSSSLNAEEVSALSKSQAIAVFAPGTEIGRATGTALRHLVDAGGAMALSSGYHPVFAPGFSMQMAVSLAIVQGGLSDEEAISAATVNAAYAAGRGGVVGTIEKGKRADLLVMTVPDYREIARQFGINHVGTVLRDGEVAFNRSRWKIVANEAAPARVRTQHF